MASGKRGIARIYFREQDGESVGGLFYIKFSKLEYTTKNRESLRVTLRHTIVHFQCQR
jgi:hypothetical protein